MASINGDDSRRATNGGATEPNDQLARLLKCYRVLLFRAIRKICDFCAFVRDILKIEILVMSFFRAKPKRAVGK